MKYLLLSLGTVALISSCSLTKKKDYGYADHLKSKYVYANDEILLKEGQNRFIKEKELNITFNKVVKDDRCAAGTPCPHDGTAVVELTLMTNTSRPQTLQISLSPKAGYPTDVANFADFQVRLKKLDPTGEPGVTKDYRAVFSVIRTTK